jgi:asparagine synthase (glutamine-hydrolysing)
MCGIVGILSLNGRSVDRPLLERMIARLHHRGPDEGGLHLDGPVGLAHARLSILDLTGGRQPMSSPDSAVVLTFNGELFNHVELRAELEALGHAFATRSDTEVLLRAWLQWADDCVHHLNGQWAFAVWDARTRTLFASRDRLGVRPLYYARVADRLLFASEIKALFADPQLSREIDPRGVEQALVTWAVQAPRTPFRDVSQLPPGCSLTVRSGRLDVRPYWDLDFPPPDTTTPPDVLAEQLRELLTDATRLRLRSDVPVGAYLSGGLDSSLITGLIRRTSDARLRTFSVTFEDAEFDESAWQQQVIEYLDVDHHQALCRTADVGRRFPLVVWHAEHPLVRTAPAPLFVLSELVRATGYKVVLTGEGADELFGGYDLFREALVRQRIALDPNGDHRDLLRQLYPYMPGLQGQPDAFLASFFRASAADLADPFFSHQPRWNLSSGLKLFLSDDLQAELKGFDLRADLAAALPTRFVSWDLLSRAQYLEARHLLPGYILSSQGDRVAMAHAVEGRFPFLDHRVVDFACRLPAWHKIDGLNEKALLKRAAVGLVPPALLARPKQPYRAPDVSAFFDVEAGRARHPWVDEVLSDEALRRAGLLKPEAVRLLVKKATTRRALGVRDGMAVTAVLSLQLLADQFTDGHGRMDGGDEC